jgi:hypothetical protein
MAAGVGTTIKQATIDDNFLTGPGEDLVAKLMAQLALVFAPIFGPYKGPDSDQQRWADYQRFDWTIRQLPAINVFESGAESKDSDNAFLNGSIQIQTFWAPNMRRSDARRVEAAFKGAMENFFASQYASDMLDELYFIQRPSKVYGLNELGKQLTWTPNAETVVESQAVPVTMLEVRYRIDLRAWYRALEFMGRTKEDPFEAPLAALANIVGSYIGTHDNETADVQVPVNITVSNP